METWKSIREFEDYKISNLGRVYSMKSGKILKQSIGTHGYYMVYLCGYRGKTIAKQVHRLISDAFIPNPDKKPCVDHINAIRSDNRIENLRWVTYRENNNNPIFRKRISEARKGEKLSAESIRKRTEKQKGYKKNYPLNNAKSKPVNQIDAVSGEIINIFPSLMEIYRIHRFSTWNVWNCCNGKKKTAYGYVWSYYYELKKNK